MATDRRTASVDYPFLFITAGIILFGLIMLTSASGPVGYKEHADSLYFVKHQILFGLVPGLIGLLFFLRLPYERWKTYAFPLLIFSIIMLLLVFIPGIGATLNKSTHSWIVVGGLFSFQPAELVKLTFLFYLAAWLEKREEAVRDVHTGLVPFLTVLGSILLLILLQPDVGTMSVIGAMAFIVYFTAGAPIVHLISLGAMGLTALGLLIKLAPYRAARFTTFLHPELDPQGIGYHINQALLAIGSGGLFGLGYGLSRQKFEYLPEVVGDSIFAVIAEEMGFVFAVLLIAAFVAFVWRGMKIAEAAPDSFGRYLVVGVVSWIAIQALVNIGSMTSILPMTGVTLPFVSYGGTSLAVCMAGVGVVLSVSRGGGNRKNV